MTFINIETYVKLSNKYQELIEYHAKKIYNQHCESWFQYFSENQTMIDLENNFGKEIAHDIYTKVVSTAMEEGVWKTSY